MAKGKKQNKKNSKKSKKNNLNISKDITGAIIIGIGIIWMISLFNFEMGIIGGFIRGITFILMGFGGYFFPLLLISIGVIFIMDRFDKKELGKIINLMVIFTFILVFLDGRNIGIKNLLERIQIANSLSLFNKGGGVVGAFLGFFIYSLFGRIGGYLLIGLVISISILIFTEKKLKDILKSMNLVNLRGKITDKKNETEFQNIKTKNLAPSNSEDIRILDYSKEDKVPIGKNPKKLDTSIEKKIIENEIEEVQIQNLDLVYNSPSLDLLNTPEVRQDSGEKKEILNNAKIIEDTMTNFGIKSKISQINRGPTITCYELSPSPGIKLSRIVSLSDNIALSLASSDIRIEAPIPGKSAVGIEVPNKIKENVYLREILNSEEYKEIESSIPLALGKDVRGRPIVSSIEKMPHLLIAGATGSGKSVCINTIIMSILYKSSPNDVKLLLIDPKVVELSVYNEIPHLLIPVVTDPKKAAFALNWAVEEMEKRYKLFAENSVRDISSYNIKMEKNSKENLSNIVIIIDELADLMMVAAQQIEDYICRLAQMARAAGIYLIVATQRPSVDVITGTIKANIPSRISFAVSSQIDSRTILDMAGAEKLLGKGDMLFYPSFYSKPLRIQGGFISHDEVEKVVNFLKKTNNTDYNEDIIDVVHNSKPIDLEDSDDLLPDAINLVVEEGQASISYLQRKLKIGYSRAARIVDEMEERDIVGGHEGSKPRKVLITKEDLEEIDENL